MASGVSECMFVRCVYEGCIGGCDWEVERRPYHRNCGCALHKSRGSCSHMEGHRKNVSYPIRRSWSEGSLALSAAAVAVAASHQSCSPSSSPANTNVNSNKRRSWMGSFDLDKEGRFGKLNHLVPLTVSNFKSVCTHPSLSYKNTLINKIFPGQYFLAGHQGRREKGEVQVPLTWPSTPRLSTHVPLGSGTQKAGVVSLSLSENDDEVEVKLNPEYRNVEFLITTGPGPCPQLDSENIDFGTVLEGMDVVTAIASIPTYKPEERIRQLKNLAEFLGDERVQIAQATWNRPLKTVYISDCGELKMSKPTLTPSLP